jgi:hypothetical protein
MSDSWDGARLGGETTCNQHRHEQDRAFGVLDFGFRYASTWTIRLWEKQA